MKAVYALLLLVLFIWCLNKKENIKFTRYKCKSLLTPRLFTQPKRMKFSTIDCNNSQLSLFSS